MLSAIKRLLKTSMLRLAALSLLSFGLSIGAVLFYIYWNISTTLNDQAKIMIAEEVRSLATVYRQGGLPRLLSTIQERSSSRQSTIYSFTNAWGLHLAGNLVGLPIEVARQKNGWVQFDFMSTEGDGHDSPPHKALAYIAEFRGGLRLLVGKDIFIYYEFHRMMQSAAFWGFGLALALGLLGSLALAKSFLRRVERMNTTVHAIMRGDLSKRIPVSGSSDELDRLAEGLNDMLTQIEKLMIGMRDVSNHIAHELKTPLTRIKAQAESALRAATAEDYQAALLGTIKNSDQLLATFNALLSIAQVEAGQNRERIGEVDLTEVVQEIAELYEPTIEDAGGEFKMKISTPISIRGDRQLLAQTLTNLLDNAIKYGRNTDTKALSIELSLEAKETEAILSVRDHGKSLAPENYAQMIKRFVRLENETTTKQSGSGLGLALVASVVHLHNGKLIFKDNVPGLWVEIHLPRSFPQIS